MQHEPSPGSINRMLNQPTFWVIVLVVALASYLVGFTTNPRQGEESESLSAPHLTEAQDIEAVRRLNEIDQLIFANAAEIAGLQTESLRVSAGLVTSGRPITPSDVAIATVQLNDQATRVDELNAKTQLFIDQRNQLLQEVGIE